ncbi:MAG: hypothetical protein LBU17_12640 [Treponema sp.]|nr:hypothetical protein [Treponema sp.]
MPFIALPRRLWRILKTAQKLKEKLKRLGIATDDWQSFVNTFTETEHTPLVLKAGRRCIRISEVSLLSLLWF